MTAQRILTGRDPLGKYRGHVNFFNWCRNNRFDPFEAATLLGLCDRAFKAGERETNTGRTADSQRRAVERTAKAMGMETRWPGLWPAFTKAGQDIHLPGVGR